MVGVITDSMDMNLGKTLGGGEGHGGHGIAKSWIFD